MRQIVSHTAWGFIFKQVNFFTCPVSLFMEHLQVIEAKAKACSNVLEFPSGIQIGVNLGKTWTK